MTELAAFCENNGEMSFIETSAKDSTNVDKAFGQIAEKVLERQASLQQEMKDKVELEKQIEASHKLRLEEIDNIGGGSERYRVRNTKMCNC